MCLFRKCDESVIETKEYPSIVDRMRESMKTDGSVWVSSDDFLKPRVTTIKCAACGRIRIDERRV